MKKFLLTLALVGFLSPSDEAVAGEKWYRYHIFQDMTLYDIFKDLVQHGMHSKSFQKFKDSVTAKNGNIKDPDLILAGDSIWVPHAKNRNPISSSPSLPATGAMNSSDACSGCQGGRVGPMSWLLAPTVGYSRIDLVESADGSTSTLLSRLNVGVRIQLNRRGRQFSDKLIIDIQEHRFETDDTRPFESNKVRVHNWIAQRDWHYWGSLSLVTALGSKETPYLSALDATRLIIDPVSQNFLASGVRYHIPAWFLSSSFRLHYYMSSFASSFRVRHGSSAYVSFLIDPDMAWVPSTYLWGEYRDLRSSVADQTQKDIGLAVGWTFP
ncbi:hypothetical protein [Pseudobacteriovorax antillogorgiicola]|uniref:Uncharacterized protein n=1 Tax=Pseudobacteriovorax antillogorgiicola TaxID=1513793 RepID=A0A1Y6BSR4_9BACT|nr:hypothetical protein [Pseudobacteriovorax antillogorgiicola]TCS53033.1 hypothetical protein EDD56_10884 [Pseudobacteriovorax antillogorgiicola]SMF26748.1 hypothetical protein SAMN06296036_108163 [Pseudobacteriovorax antillogorgiicola]